MKIIKEVFLRGRQIYLRALEENDLEGNYLEWINDTEITTYMTTGLFPQTKEMLQQYYKSVSNDRNAVYFAIIDNKKDYGKLDIIYGARSYADLCYMDEFAAIEKNKDANVHLSIDVKEDGWKKFVGFVPDNLLKVNPTPKDTIAITCGPPIMIKFVIQNLEKLGYTDDQIYTTLEMRMKCGIGKCGRCNIGNVYVCKDGPVFSYKELKNIKGER